MLRSSLRTVFYLSIVFSLFPSLRAADAIAHLEKGAFLPAAVLLNDAGDSVGLDSVIKGKPTVLIFYRGGWCPYCSKHLSGLVDILDGLQAAGAQLVAISPDRPAKLREKTAFGELPYQLLSDSSMEVSKSFGIAFQVEDALVEKYKSKWGIDLEGDSGETHHLLPHPSVFVVDGKGMIQFAHVNADYKKRLDPKKVLAAAKAVSGQ